MEKFKKEDVKVLYNAFIKLCDYIELRIGCWECPLYKIETNGCRCNDFVESLKRIIEVIESDKKQ